MRTDECHHRADAITSGLAAIGISIALVGGKGWESAGDWAALLASGIIMFNAYLVLRDSKNRFRLACEPVLSGDGRLPRQLSM